MSDTIKPVATICSGGFGLLWETQPLPERSKVYDADALAQARADALEEAINAIDLTILDQLSPGNASYARALCIAAIRALKASPPV